MTQRDHILWAFEALEDACKELDVPDYNGEAVNFLNALWHYGEGESALDSVRLAHGMDRAEDVAQAVAIKMAGAVESTGGGCYAVVIPVPSGFIYVTDGDHQPPNGRTAYVSAYNTDDEWIESEDRELLEPYSVDELCGLIQEVATSVGKV